MAKEKKSNDVRGTFKVLTTPLGGNSMDPDYVTVMQDVFVDKSGRYKIIEEKSSIDPQTADVIATVKYVEYEETGNSSKKEDDGL